jgi:hypothetical protein
MSVFLFVCKFFSNEFGLIVTKMENKRRNEEKKELMRSPQPRSNVWKRRLNLKVNLLLPFVQKQLPSPKIQCNNRASGMRVSERLIKMRYLWTLKIQP